MKSNCPVCDADLSFDNTTMLGELLECPDCGTELEVVNLNPLKVDEAPQAEEDWGE